MSVRFAAFEDGPLRKEAIFLIGLVVEAMMTKNRFEEIQYAREDVNDFVRGMTQYKLNWLTELKGFITTRKHFWVRQNIFVISIWQGTEPTLKISLANFARVPQFHQILGVLSDLTGCHYVKTEAGFEIHNRM